MRRLIAPAALIAVLALAGCSPSEAESAEVSTKAALDAVCAPYERAYDQFSAVAEKPGRSDEEMLEARKEMLATWDQLEQDAREHDSTIADLIALNSEHFQEGVSGSAQGSDYYALFRDGYDGFLELCM